MNRRFDGFRKTPFLWKGMLEGLEMYSKEEYSMNEYPNIDPTSHIRLGKLTEQFVLFELEQDQSVELLKSNVQVFRDQITIGELDCLIKQSEVNIHLEIVYKFYLYDPSILTELNRWVGPNRNDSLVLKLNKLKEKQLPLLYSPESVELLFKLKMNPNDFIQRLNFKAQLFVPLNSPTSPFQFVNNDCIKGFYIHYLDLKLFTGHSFYIPAKLDWLIDPYLDVKWISIEIFKPTVSKLLAENKSPLCWMKSPEGIIQKFFIVWWKLIES